MEATRMKIDQGFLPILGHKPKVLILGTMPSVRSLEDQQYYAHPQNAFWWIMSELLGFDLLASYAERTHCLSENNIAVWDVISSCHRPGSLDSAIDQSSLTANNFSALIEQNTSIALIVFNGQTAHKLFKKYVSLSNYTGSFLVMPSTSPANAATNRDAKLASWRAIQPYL